MAPMNATTVIARPLEQVFAFFLALDESVPKLDQGASVLKTPDGPPRVGTVFRLRQPRAGQMRESTTRFTAVENGRRIAFDAEIGPLRPRAELLFQRAGDGTQVTFRGDSNAPGVLRLFSPLFNRKGQQAWEQRLARAKAVLEASTP